MTGMPLRVPHRDHRSERRTEDERVLDLERCAQCDNIVGPDIERPLGGRTPIAPPHPALIEEHHLHPISEGSQLRFERAVVVARSPMKQQEGRSLPQPITVGDVGRTGQVYEEPDARFNFYAHR